MKAKLVNKYNKVSETTGSIVRVYVYSVISATADELADYQATQTAYKEDEDGNPLYFTTTFEGNLVDIVKGKTKDRLTGSLVDTWRPLSSEDFELKRSIMTASTRTASVAPAVVKKTAAPIAIDDVEY
jgi:hypothetical protein